MRLQSGYKNYLPFCFLLLTAWLLAGSAWAQTELTVAKNATLYTEASAQSRVMLQLPAGSKVYTIEESKGNFVYVAYSGRTGYILRSLTTRNGADLQLSADTPHLQYSRGKVLSGEWEIASAGLTGVEGEGVNSEQVKASPVQRKVKKTRYIKQPEPETQAREQSESPAPVRTQAKTRSQASQQPAADEQAFSGPVTESVADLLNERGNANSNSVQSRAARRPAEEPSYNSNRTKISSRGSYAKGGNRASIREEKVADLLNDPSLDDSETGYQSEEEPAQNASNSGYSERMPGNSNNQSAGAEPKEDFSQTIVKEDLVDKFERHVEEGRKVIVCLSKNAPEYHADKDCKHFKRTCDGISVLNVSPYVAVYSYGKQPCAVCY
ncbi:MAG: hypothetical protein V4543_14560 [Bacteroidota bacterium]